MPIRTVASYPAGIPCDHATYEKLTILGMNRYQGWKEDGEVDICVAGNMFAKPIPYEQFRHGMQVMDDYGTMVML